ADAVYLAGDARAVGRDLADQIDRGRAAGRHVHLITAAPRVRSATARPKRAGNDEVVDRVAGGDASGVSRQDAVVGGDGVRGCSRGAGISDHHVAAFHQVVETQILQSGAATVVDLNTPDDVVVIVAVDGI